MCITVYTHMAPPKIYSFYGWKGVPFPPWNLPRSSCQCHLSIATPLIPFSRSFGGSKSGKNKQTSRKQKKHMKKNAQALGGPILEKARNNAIIKPKQNQKKQQTGVVKCPILGILDITL